MSLADVTALDSKENFKPGWPKSLGAFQAPPGLLWWAVSRGRLIPQEEPRSWSHSPDFHRICRRSLTQCRVQAISRLPSRAVDPRQGSVPLGIGEPSRPHVATVHLFGLYRTPTSGRGAFCPFSFDILPGRRTDRLAAALTRTLRPWWLVHALRAFRAIDSPTLGTSSVSPPPLPWCRGDLDLPALREPRRVSHADSMPRRDLAVATGDPCPKTVTVAWLPLFPVDSLRDCRALRRGTSEYCRWLNLTVVGRTCLPTLRGRETLEVLDDARYSFRTLFASRQLLAEAPGLSGWLAWSSRPHRFAASRRLQPGCQSFAVVTVIRLSSGHSCGSSTYLQERVFRSFP